jgi:prolyl-tRNA synthetase
MRWTEGLIPTLKETPSDAEIASHKLMLRAGMMRKLSAGIYSLLPLGWRATRRVEEIVREEMDREGSQELLLPAVQPSDLWKETGRWDDYGEELMKVTDRHKRDFVLGPTHEEVLTDLARRELRSYKQLPLILYQIQTKFRDEVRPRFGVMRAREFIMKDAYSFDRDRKGLDVSYRKMYDAYSRIFSRCGLTFRAVEADSGAIGGSEAHEFMALADCGEAEVLSCPECDYAANIERAEVRADEAPSGPSEAMKELKKVRTPEMKTVEAVAAFLGVTPERLIKTILYKASGKVVAALVRGDHEINEIKLRRALGALSLEMADPETVTTVTGAAVGYAGPVGLGGVKLIADRSVQGMANAVTGANADDAHLVGVNLNRDFKVDLFADIRLARSGDPCPRCGGPMVGSRGIEVGQVFKLGTKYSDAMGATFADEDGTSKPIIMGCYGIGITRTVAAVIEQSHDDRGITWPPSVAPYIAIITPVNAAASDQMEVSEIIYREMRGAGLSAILDDRDERAGVKFKDADLIGMPVRLTVGDKALKEGKVEIKLRRTGQEFREDKNKAVSTIKELLKSI